ncbi:MAG TPA: SlyX family protein [Planctomycetota bacterium]|nr:SlyX family protein [Planctomycetota bacterium]
MSTDRIDIETKVAMLEHTVDALSGELHQHAQAIALLQEQLRSLVQHLRPKHAEPDLGPHDSPPPHYGAS